MSCVQGYASRFSVFQFRVKHVKHQKHWTHFWYLMFFRVLRCFLWFPLWALTVAIATTSTTHRPLGCAFPSNREWWISLPSAPLCHEDDKFYKCWIFLHIQKITKQKILLTLITTRPIHRPLGGVFASNREWWISLPSAAPLCHEEDKCWIFLHNRR